MYINMKDNRSQCINTYLGLTGKLLYKLEESSSVSVGLNPIHVLDPRLSFKRNEKSQPPSFNRNETVYSASRFNSFAYFICHALGLTRKNHLFTRCRRGNTDVCGLGFKVALRQEGGTFFLPN